MTWHADASLLARYAAGSIDDARASSVEAHLVACADCRQAVATTVDTTRLDAIWAEVTDTVDAPRPRLVERFLRRIGVRDHVARLLAATPSLRLSWLLAMTASLVFVAAAASEGSRQPVLFLVVAPLLPVAGVAGAFASAFDPTYELATAAPMSNVRLLLLRAAAVMATTTLLAGLAAFALPVLDWTAAAWLLPSLGLTLASLALATWLTPEAAAGVVTAVWIAVVAASAGAADDRLAAFHAAGQVGCLVAVAVSALVLVRRRAALEVRRAL